MKLRAAAVSAFLALTTSLMPDLALASSDDDADVETGENSFVGSANAGAHGGRGGPRDWTPTPTAAGIDPVGPAGPRDSGLDPICVREAIGQQQEIFDFCAPPTDPADPAAPAEAAAPVITPAIVLQAFQEVPLPDAVLTIQPPDGLTLVNFDTNFLTEAEPFVENLTLLTNAVDLDITPTSYTWDFGDGTTRTTTTPGAPYPDLEVTHAYGRTGTYQLNVTITWSADFRVNGGPWIPVDGTVPITSPDVALQVQEGTPVLVD